ncbi:hypothetical protein GCM10022252_20910 [Streptosporangium oxazolinicum]|uniref:DUF1990 domain-containing protein n=1 Tax=Streptosporangium oxazolinicum TaxID=909287 RepID=A0ABP8APH3_9ACTN
MPREQGTTMELMPPVPEPTALDLVAVPRLGRPAAAPRLPGRVSLSRPYVRRLIADEADGADEGERSEFVRAGAGADFYLLSLVCSFRPGPDPFVDASLGVLLDSPAPHEPPIAWSMTPKLATAPSGNGVKLTIGAKLMFVESQLEYAPEEKAEEHYLVGLGEHQSDPEWRFRRTSRHPLLGDERVTLVVRGAAGAPVSARLMLAATFRQARLGMIRYRAELSPALREIDLTAHAEPPAVGA